MKRALSLLAVFAVLLSAQPLTLAAIEQNTGEVAGTAIVEGKPLPNIRVRLRNVDTNQIVANQRTNAQGQFRFTGLAAANYVVEVVSDDDRVLASVPVALTAGSLVVTGVTVTVSQAVLAGAAGAVGAAAGGSFFATTAGLITLGLIGAGITEAIIIATDDGSPSR